MEKDELTIALVQANTSGESIGANLAMLEEMLETTDSQTDIMLLPELFNTGYQNAFTTKPEMMGMQTHRWMKQMAERKKSAICGSVAISEGGFVFNRILFVSPDGQTQHYDKVNVFKFSGEDKLFSVGKTLPLFSFLGWTIKPSICFDIRFPETIRNQDTHYDLILCSAHWPNPRIAAWDKLLQARAIENQSFLAAVNRFGDEGEIHYSGHSVGLDFMGNQIAETSERAEIKTFSISKSSQLNFREKFPFLK